MINSIFPYFLLPLSISNSNPAAREAPLKFKPGTVRSNLSCIISIIQKNLPNMNDVRKLMRVPEEIGLTEN